MINAIFAVVGGSFEGFDRSNHRPEVYAVELGVLR